MRHPDIQRLILATVACVTAAAAAGAHDVTTRVTWNREVSRIVYARCAQCHRPGGSAFSLLTYQEASPWATAIRDSVMQRTMPPWGAVKGFGAFRNEQALSQEELGLVENWANGGAPEGNPNDLPARVRLAAPAPRETTGGGLTVSGDYTFAAPFLLDGFRLAAASSIASARITMTFPDGRIAPLVWLYNYSAGAAHPFLLRTALPIPPGVKIRGVPSGAVLELFPATSAAVPATSTPAAR